MIRRAPAEVYIRYLLCHPDGYNNQAVRAQVEELVLYCPFDHELEALRRKYRPPYPYYPLNRTHIPSMQFLKNSGIFSLFFPDKSTNYAFDILHNHNARIMVEQRLAQRASPEIVVAGLDNRYQFACSADGVRKYQHFFFSDDSTRTDLQQAVDLSLSGWAQSSNREITPAHIAAENRARKHDPRTISLNMPTCVYTQLKAGVEDGRIPKNLQRAASNWLAFSIVNAGINLAIACARGGMDGAQEAFCWTRIVHELQELAEKIQTPVELVLKEVVSDLQIVSDTTKPITLKQLTKGNCTTDVQPLGKTQVDEVESVETEQEEPGDTDNVEDEEHE